VLSFYGHKICADEGGEAVLISTKKIFDCDEGVPRAPSSQSNMSFKIRVTHVFNKVHLNGKRMRTLEDLTYNATFSSHACQYLQFLGTESVKVI
jgi:hypothetical protein